MITKGGSRGNRRFFARHFLNTKDNERARVVGVYGFGHEDVNAAWRDMEAFAKDKPNCKNYFFAVSLNPEPGEELSEEQWKKAETIALQRYGAEGQPYISYEHEKHGRIHRHLAIARVDRESGDLISDSLTYRKNEAISREIEREFGLSPTESTLVKDRQGPRPSRRAKDYEGFRAARTGLKAEQVTAEVTALWNECDTGTAFRAALEENGYVLCKGDRVPFCVVDPAGKDHSLTRRIEGGKAADVYARMKDLDREALPSVEEGRNLVSAWDDNEAARCVRMKLLNDRLKAAREAIPSGPEDTAWIEERMGRAGFEYQPSWSTLEQAAKEYGVTVEQMAHGLQDAYWLTMHGVKPKTEADKLHEVMWGGRVKERGGFDLDR